MSCIVVWFLNVDTGVVNFCLINITTFIVVGHHWRLAILNSTVIVLSITSQISYASTSAALSDRSVYPNLFRTVPSDESLAPALATVMQYYGWRTLSILTEQQAQFTAVHPLHACMQQTSCAPSLCATLHFIPEAC